MSEEGSALAERSTEENSYDLLPYPSSPFAQTHPRRLGTIAKLFGMDPADMGRARVLEIGCSDGGNLVPMALELPESRFVGIDGARTQIESGRSTVQALSLSNIDLRHENVLDVGEDLGEFDYIISHGVYSWVPADVQEKILALSKTCLAPHGVAYVSYNTYPGWRMREMLRDMMLYHTRQFGDVPRRIQQARALIKFLAESVSTEDSAYGILLKKELEAMKRYPDTYIFHEVLEDVNEPTYFYQFAERAGQHGLIYLGEAEFHTMLASNFGQNVFETLKKVGRDIIAMEQYMDFLRNRTFRQTLLCHAGTKLRRNLTPDHLAGFHVAAPLRVVSGESGVPSDEEMELEGRNQAKVRSRDPLIKGALTELRRLWPKSIAFEELVDHARATVSRGNDAGADRQKVGHFLLRCYSQNVVELQISPPEFTLEVSERPRTSPLIRLQAEHGRTVTNFRHEPMNIDIAGQVLLRYLDGTRDRAALLEVLEEHVQDGTLVVRQQNEPVQDPGKIREILDAQLSKLLERYAKAALLAG